MSFSYILQTHFCCDSARIYVKNNSICISGEDGASEMHYEYILPGLNVVVHTSSYKEDEWNEVNLPKSFDEEVYNFDNHISVGRNNHTLTVPENIRKMTTELSDVAPGILVNGTIRRGINDVPNHHVIKAVKKNYDIAYNIVVDSYTQFITKDWHTCIYLDGYVVYTGRLDEDTMEMVEKRSLPPAMVIRGRSDVSIN